LSSGSGLAVRKGGVPPYSPVLPSRAVSEGRLPSVMSCRQRASSLVRHVPGVPPGRRLAGQRGAAGPSRGLRAVHLWGGGLGRRGELVSRLRDAVDRVGCRGIVRNVLHGRLEAVPRAVQVSGGSVLDVLGVALDLIPVVLHRIDG